VIDEADGRAQPSVGELGEQPVLGLRPEFRNVGEVLVIDDDEDIVVGEIAPDRVLDPVAAG
jgi:hypothetical protein